MSFNILLFRAAVKVMHLRMRRFCNALVLRVDVNAVVSRKSCDVIPPPTICNCVLWTNHNAAPLQVEIAVMAHTNKLLEFCPKILGVTLGFSFRNSMISDQSLTAFGGKL